MIDRQLWNEMHDSGNLFQVIKQQLNYLDYNNLDGAIHSFFLGILPPIKIIIAEDLQNE